MKLSDVKGARTLDVVADLVAPLTAIAADPQTAALLEKRSVPQGMEPRRYAMERLQSALPGLIRTHRGDLTAILAALAGVSPEEYAASMTLPSLLGELLELISDQELLRLFS